MFGFTDEQDPIVQDALMVLVSSDDFGGKCRFLHNTFKRGKLKWGVNVAIREYLKLENPLSEVDSTQQNSRFYGMLIGTMGLDKPMTLESVALNAPQMISTGYKAGLQAMLTHSSGVTRQKLSRFFNSRVLPFFTQSPHTCTTSHLCYCSQHMSKVGRRRWRNDGQTFESVCKKYWENQLDTNAYESCSSRD